MPPSNLPRFRKLGLILQLDPERWKRAASWIGNATLESTPIGFQSAAILKPNQQPSDRFITKYKRAAVESHPSVIKSRADCMGPGWLPRGAACEFTSFGPEDRGAFSALGDDGRFLSARRWECRLQKDLEVGFKTADFLFPEAVKFERL